MMLSWNTSPPYSDLIELTALFISLPVACLCLPACVYVICPLFFNSALHMYASITNLYQIYVMLDVLNETNY